MVNVFTELELQSSSRALPPKNQKDIMRCEASRRLVWVCCERRRQTPIRRSRSPRAVRKVDGYRWRPVPRRALRHR
eukprot:773175-Pyramimonas_sp.AAC.1